MGMVAKQAAQGVFTPSVNMFGVPGMTTGAVSIITMMLTAAVIWFIRGMADRKRADNEGVTTLSGAHDALFKTMQTAHDVQFKNMQAAHAVLLSNMQNEVARLTALVTALSTELNTVKKELAEERRARLGEIKNSIQVDLAASSIIAEKLND